MDVSFISATLVFPAVINAARETGSNPTIVVLVKPQFEVGRENVGKGGIVRDEEAQLAAVKKVEAALRELNYEVAEAIESPILELRATENSCFTVLYNPRTVSRVDREHP